MTKSELLLEDILKERNIEFEKIPESVVSGKLTPDYLVRIDGMNTYWEVKELTPNKDERLITASIKNEALDDYSINSERVREHIKKACNQFTSYEVVNNPCVVVLHDARPLETLDVLFLQFIMQAMLGKGELQDLGNGLLVEINRSNALLTKNNKKYISAVVVIYQETKEAVFLHNPNASIPLTVSSLKKYFEYHFVAVFTDSGLKWEKI